MATSGHHWFSLHRAAAKHFGRLTPQSWHQWHPEVAIHLGEADPGEARHHLWGRVLDRFCGLIQCFRHAASPPPLPFAGRRWPRRVRCQRGGGKNLRHLRLRRHVGGRHRGGPSEEDGQNGRTHFARQTSWRPHLGQHGGSGSGKDDATQRQSAATAAVLALENHGSVQAVDYGRLVADGQVLEFAPKK